MIDSVRVFVDGVLRKVFESNRYVITGEWGRLHIEWLHDLFPTNIIRVIKYRRKSVGVGGNLACMRDRKSACGVLKGKILIERPEGRYRHRGECNIKKDL